MGAPAYFPNFTAPAPILDQNLPSPTLFIAQSPKSPNFFAQSPISQIPHRGPHFLNFTGFSTPPLRFIGEHSLRIMCCLKKMEKKYTFLLFENFIISSPK